MFPKATRLFEIGGFEIRVDASWLFIAALVVWSLSTGWFPDKAPGLSATGYLILSVIAMLGMFGCLILHELAHSLVARRFGLGVGGITLFIFGGAAELEAEPESARSEFWIAAAGPAASLALALLAATAAQLFQPRTPAETVLTYLASINVTLAVFNLIPAFPLDGGRVLRSLIWGWSGDLLRATYVASAAGAAFGWVLILAGVVTLLAYGDVLGLWPVLVGLFVMTAARVSYEQVVLKATLGARTVASIMTSNPLVVEPQTTLADLVDKIMLAHGISFVPVVQEGRLLGYVDAAAIRMVDRALWPITPVASAMDISDPENTLAPGLPAHEVLKHMAAGNRRKFLVAEGGQLNGVLSLSDLIEFITL